MTQLYASVAIGTAATLLAIILLLLRAKFRGRRPAVVLVTRRVATGTRTSGFVLALLSAIAVYAFARNPANELGGSSSTSALSVLAGSASAPSVQGTAADRDKSSPAAQALDDLRAYVDTIDTKRQSTAAISPAPNSVEVPDVDTMIGKLVARLDKQPDDVRGWKMLGWSYLNTNRSEEAARAYETALKLEPGDIEIKKALEQAKSAQILAIQTPRSDPSDAVISPTTEDIKAAEDLTAAQRNRMIRGMVQQLATRLETSPNNEEGWLLLMRSHMTLGEKDAAKAALTNAVRTFASDASVKARLTAAARELGVESN